MPAAPPSTAAAQEFFSIMKTKLIALSSILVAITALAQFGPSRTTYFPITNAVPAGGFFVINTGPTNNVNVAISNAPALLDSFVVAPYFGTITNVVNWTNDYKWAGIVKLMSGTNSYFITNSAFGTNSLVVVSVLDDDATITSVKALNIATNVVQLKANGSAAANCRLGWKLISK